VHFQALARVIPHLAVSHQGWLFASTFATTLTVYRSSLVRPTDEIYRPVAEFVREHLMVLVVSDSMPDTTKMFGTGVVEIYKREVPND
jgi:hypothetical protein